MSDPERDDGGPSDGPAAGRDAARDALNRARAAARQAGGRVDPATGGPRRRATTRRGPGDGRDPLLLGDAVQELLDQRGWRGAASVAGVLGRWDEIVGPEVAGHVQPDSFEVETGVLVLRADSTAWATVIRLQVSTLASRIGEEVGTGVVRTIRVAGPAAPRWTHGPRTVKGRGPRDTYG